MSAKTENVSPLNEERTGNVREVGSEAVWSLSSCKPGFGVEQLRDNSTETYWQSDGQLPHLINIQFPRKTTVSHIYLFSDYKLDESYTPSRISIRSGTHFNDLQEIEVVDLCEPSGWVCIAVKDMREKPIRTFMLQIAIISNHQNGRDSHCKFVYLSHLSPISDRFFENSYLGRQVRIHSPAEGRTYPLEMFGEFSTVDFQAYSTIR